jgi:transcription antitermination protein NusB
MSRRAARLAAVEILYAADVRATSTEQLLSERDDCDEYCLHLVNAVRGRQGEIDVLLGEHARGWTTDRMSPVDLNVMRVAALELLEGAVPPAAAIDEAIVIAKRFSGEEAGRFVNGVLEAVRQAVGSTGGSGGTGG